MMAERGYFDWNATAPVRPEARAAVLVALDSAGNPSSVHADGRAARRLIETAREQVAALVGAEPRNVVFTSGATEANSLALTPAIEARGARESRDTLFVSAIEHPSVLCGGRFPADRIEQLPVRPDGVIDLTAIAPRLAKATRPLVSVTLASNETGVVQPVRHVADIVHAAGGLLHVDAVQGAGRIACDIGDLGADLLTLSSHKLGGPQGAGALVRRGDVHIAEPLVRGGGQERSQRGGTENVPGIAGFGAACAVAMSRREPDARRMAALRDRLEAGLRAATPGAVIVGASAERLPNTTLVAVPGIKAETALIAFDLKGMALSAGSACSSGRVQASHVLAAMGMAPALMRSALRISLGWSTTEQDVESLLNAWKSVISSLLKSQHTEGLAA